MKKRNIVLLARAFAIEILSALNKVPLRFVDLEKYCPNESTRATRIKELKSGGFITVTIREIGDQSFIHYQITEKGRRALELIEQLEEL